MQAQPFKRPSRPALLYFGGKWRLAPWIISHFPDHVRYVEPFGGAAGVLLSKPPSKYELYNDLNSEVAEFFRVLRNPTMARRLLKALKRTPYGRDELRLASRWCSDPVERARRLAIRSMQSFHPRAVFDRSITLNTRGGSTSPARTWVNYTLALAGVASRLRNVVIENRPALDVIADQDGPGTLFYVDPPYVSGTRTSGTRYRHDMGDADHVALLEVLNNVQGRVVLSGYNCELYHDLLPGWTAKSHQARVSNSQVQRDEVVWLSPGLKASVC